MGDPEPGPAAQAAADVERLLAGAPGLQRIVDLAEAVGEAGNGREAGSGPDDPSGPQSPGPHVE